MNIAQMMKQAQQLQEKMQQMQADLLTMEIVGVSGAGAVEVRLNGKGDMLSLKIDPSLLKPEDAEMVEDLVVAAHKNARNKAEAAMQEKMKEATGGLPLPPGFKLF
jgi:hypothetical protein